MITTALIVKTSWVNHSNENPPFLRQKKPENQRVAAPAPPTALARIFLRFCFEEHTNLFFISIRVGDVHNYTCSHINNLFIDLINPTASYYYQTTMDVFHKQTTLEPYFAKSFGCAAFSSVAKGGLFVVGGAYGSGDVYKLTNGQEEHVCKVDLMQASVGWVLGGEVFSEIVFFETESDFNRFMSGNFEFSANAKAVALTANISANVTTMGNQGIQAGLTPEQTSVRGFKNNVEYTKGMKVFTLTLGGLMYEATIGGQKFTVKNKEQSFALATK
jgi:hypothetical protein